MKQNLMLVCILPFDLISNETAMQLARRTSHNDALYTRMTVW